MLKRSTYPYYTSTYKDLYLLNTPYCFHFNGKENDNEVLSSGNWQDYGLRMYSTRLGRFPSPDPLIKKYPWYTPYQFSGNNPIRFIDLDGGEPKDPPGMWLSNPGSKDYGDPYNQGGTLTLVNDKETKAKYFVYQQCGINGGSDFHWYSQDAKKWLSFNPYGYVEQGSWQNTEQGQGNFESFQGAIRQYEGLFKLTNQIGYTAATLSTGGFGGASATLIRGYGFERAAAGFSDMVIQLATGKTFNKDYNYTSTFANALFPNSSFVSASIGAYGEATMDAGFTLGKTKSFGDATLEATFGTLGNIAGDRVGNYGIKLSGSNNKFEQFGFKFLGGALGNSSSTAVSTIK